MTQLPTTAEVAIATAAYNEAIKTATEAGETIDITVQVEAMHAALMAVFSNRG